MFSEASIWVTCFLLDAGFLLFWFTIPHLQSRDSRVHGMTSHWCWVTCPVTECLHTWLQRWWWWLSSRHNQLQSVSFQCHHTWLQQRSMQFSDLHIRLQLVDDQCFHIRLQQCSSQSYSHHNLNWQIIHNTKSNNSIAHCSPLISKTNFDKWITYITILQPISLHYHRNDISLIA